MSGLTWRQPQPDPTCKRVLVACEFSGTALIAAALWLAYSAGGRA